MEEHRADELEIDVETLQDWFASDSNFHLVDVRESWERDIVKLDDDQHMPLSEIGNKVDSFENFDEPVVFYCHHGIRSLKVAKTVDDDVSEAFSLAGGIDAWAKEIDPDIPTY